MVLWLIILMLLILWESILNLKAFSGYLLDVSDIVPVLKRSLSIKYPAEKITVEELFPGIDGKYRYITRDRIDIFRGLSERLKKHFPETFIIFMHGRFACME
jgi:hypothetical protein